MSTPAAGQPLDPAAQATFDYAQQVNQREGNTGFLGGLIATLDSFAGAAQTGQFSVDGDTAKLINDKLSSIQDIVASGKLQLSGSQTRMPIGQGYAQQVAQRNDVIASNGADQFAAFHTSLEQLKQAINSSVAGYQGSDQAAHTSVNRAGNY
jgi:hypothetical protein